MRLHLLAILLVVSATACTSDSDPTGNYGPSPTGDTAQAGDAAGGGDTAGGGDAAGGGDSVGGGDVSAGDPIGPGDGTMMDGGPGDASAGDSMAGGDYSGTTCIDDGDCGSEHWCRDAEAGGKECVPYALEGDYCGGFTLPSYVEACHPDQFICTDVPPFIPDSPGNCRRSCESSPCPNGQFCSDFNTVCRDIGACFDHLDCDAAANNPYPHDSCAGYGTCTSGSCSWSCGDAGCRDLQNRIFGFCATPLGWAVNNGACVQISGCDPEGYTFFTSFDECNTACY